jgi:hypothetical protein
MSAFPSQHVGVTKTMIERVETCFDLRPQRLAGETGYGRQDCSNSFELFRNL